MNLAQALHSTACRYCQERSRSWFQKAHALRQSPAPIQNRSHYQQQLLDYYGRAHVLNIICSEVERLNPDELEDIEETRHLILRSGQEAEESKPRPNMGQSTPLQYVKLEPRADTQIAVEQERVDFCSYIQQLSSSSLQSTELLPYRRVLSPSESDVIWSNLRTRWQIIGNYWYPLSNCNLSNIIAFQANAFEEFCTPDILIQFLLSRDVKRIWELREYGIEYVQDVSLFEPIYSNFEGYWSSENLDWIVYASHEESITVGGWLLESIKTHWQDWEQHTW